MEEAISSGPKGMEMSPSVKEYPTKVGNEDISTRKRSEFNRGCVREQCPCQVHTLVRKQPCNSVTRHQNFNGDVAQWQLHLLCKQAYRGFEFPHLHQFQCGMTERPSPCGGGMTLGPSHFNLNQRQGELLYGVRSTDWAENPQVACNWFRATSDARITTSY